MFPQTRVHYGIYEPFPGVRKSSSESASESCSVVSGSLRPHGSPWNSPGQNIGVGSLSLLQEIFPTQQSNPGLPHCRRILYQLSHKGSPRILEWVAYSFSSRSSQPRNWTRVSCIAGGFFNNWAMNLTNSRKKTEGTQGWTKIGEKKGLSPYLHIQILASWIYIFKLWNQSQAN